VNCAASKKEAAELLELQRDLRAVSKATTGVSLAPPSAFFYASARRPEAPCRPICGTRLAGHSFIKGLLQRHEEIEEELGENRLKRDEEKSGQRKPR
jgi:hypothetical protein